MKIKSLVFSVALLSSCGSNVFIRHKNQESTPTSVEQLTNKVNLYESLDKPKEDANGFIMSDQCDSLLFTGLYSSALGNKWNGNIESARSINKDNRVQWFRRPAQDCGVGGKLSASTISRDMMIGLFWHMWTFKRLDLADELMQDLKSHKYVLAGEGSLGELLMNPAMMNTLALMIQKMGGKSYQLELALPYLQTAGDGFVSHLTTWHILLRASVLGGTTDNELSVLKSLMEREPQNPLFNLAYHKYSDGKLDDGVNLLLDNSQWPSDKLPTSSNHCSDWPIQRDKGKDWEPCSEQGREFTGGEVVVIYGLMIRT